MSSPVKSIRWATALLAVLAVASPRAGLLAAEPDHCEHYAREAVEQQAENLERGCGFVGGAWTSDYQGHYNWCLRVDRQAAEDETEARRADLVACPAEKDPRTGATLYEHANFRGRSEAVFGDDPSLRDNPIGNDRVSSVRLEPGCRLTLYQHDGFRGRSSEFREDAATLKGTQIGNDQASSFKLVCDDDRTKLQGVWFLEESGSVLVVIGESSMMFGVSKGPYELDPGARPKTLRHLGDEGPASFIYKFEGETLVLAMVAWHDDQSRSFDDSLAVWRLKKEICDAEMTDSEWVRRSCGLRESGNVLSLVAAGDHILAGTGRGVYRTDDEGRSWERVGGGLGGSIHHAVAVRDDVIFVGTTDPGIFRSEDGGKSWARSNSGLKVYGEDSHAPIHDFLLREDVFWVSTSDCVYFSKDQGRTWTLSADGLPDPPHGGKLAAIGDTLFLAANYGKGTFRSQDGGRSWVRTAQLPPSVEVSPANISDLETHGDTLLLAALYYGVFSTRDSGRSWSWLLEGMPACLRPESGERQCLLEDLWVDDERILAAADGRLYRLRRDQTWQEVGGDRPDASKVFVHGGIVYVGSGRNVLARRVGAWLDAED